MESMYKYNLHMVKNMGANVTPNAVVKARLGQSSEAVFQALLCCRAECFLQCSMGQN